MSRIERIENKLKILDSKFNESFEKTDFKAIKIIKKYRRYLLKALYKTNPKHKLIEDLESRIKAFELDLSFNYSYNTAHCSDLDTLSDLKDELDYMKS